MLEEDIEDWVILGGILLHQTVREDDGVDEIKKDIEQWVYDGGLLLHAAVQESSKSTGSKSVTQVKLLLRHGVRIGVRDENDATVLHVAAKSDNYMLWKVLSAHSTGADLEAKNMHGATPLHNASRKGSSQIVSYLINAKCNIDALTDEEDTPLHEAIRKNKIDNMKTLILAGANLRGYRATKLPYETKQAYHEAVSKRDLRHSAFKYCHQYVP